MDSRRGKPLSLRASSTEKCRRLVVWWRFRRCLRRRLVERRDRWFALLSCEDHVFDFVPVPTLGAGTRDGFRNGIVFPRWRQWAGFDPLFSGYLFPVLLMQVFTIRAEPREG